MAYVVTEPCINCRYGECVEVCPVEAFHQGPNFMAIDPEVCINCSICEMICPVAAIKSEYDLKDTEQQFTEINRRLANTWPAVNVGDGPLPEADAWSSRRNKVEFLE
ncbi:ferredoxin family protein [Cupriavidus necator]|uniref:DUF3470 domain-containing protein n=1 Tax=Cupriavidus necator TaxID=106590 RepID=UPI0005B51CF0